MLKVLSLQSLYLTNAHAMLDTYMKHVMYSDDWVDIVQRIPVWRIGTQHLQLGHLKLPVCLQYSDFSSLGNYREWQTLVSLMLYECITKSFPFIASNKERLYDYLVSHFENKCLWPENSLVKVKNVIENRNILEYC